MHIFLKQLYQSTTTQYSPVGHDTEDFPKKILSGTILRRKNTNWSHWPSSPGVSLSTYQDTIPQMYKAPRIKQHPKQKKVQPDPVIIAIFRKHFVGLKLCWHGKVPRFHKAHKNVRRISEIPGDGKKSVNGRVISSTSFLTPNFLSVKFGVKFKGAL